MSGIGLLLSEHLELDPNRINYQCDNLPDGDLVAIIPTDFDPIEPWKGVSFGQVQILPDSEPCPHSLDETRELLLD